MSPSGSREKPNLPVPEEMPTEDLLVTLSGSVRAADLIARYAVTDLARRTHGELVRDGLPPAAARRIACALELGRRTSHRRLARGEPLRSSQVIFEAFHARMRDLRVEQFWLVLIDSKNRIMRDVLISQGTLSSSLVHPREVFREAILGSAAAILMAHNHPSGDPEPSQEDRDLTRRIEAVGELVGIRVLDHVVIGDGAYVSFLDRGWIGS